MEVNYNLRFIKLSKTKFYSFIIFICNINYWQITFWISVLGGFLFCFFASSFFPVSAKSNPQYYLILNTIFTIRFRSSEIFFSDISLFLIAVEFTCEMKLWK